MTVADNRGGGEEGVIWFQSRLQIPRVRVDVTCIVTRGQEAWVGGVFERPFLYASNFGLPRRYASATSRCSCATVARRVSWTACTPVICDVPRQPGFSPCNIQCIRCSR